MSLNSQQTRFRRDWFHSRLGWTAMGTINSPVPQFEKPGFNGVPSIEKEHFMAYNSRPLTVEAAEKIKALAHPQRFAIMATLVDGPKSVGELVDILDMRQPAVSQMLARLRESNLVRSKRDGKQVFYYASDEQTIKMVLSLSPPYLS